MTCSDIYTKKGIASRVKSLEATETILRIEREQRERDQIRLTRALVEAISSGIGMRSLAIEDTPEERNFLRSIIVHFARDQYVEWKDRNLLKTYELEFENQEI